MITIEAKELVKSMRRVKSKDCLLPNTLSNDKKYAIIFDPCENSVMVYTVDTGLMESGLLTDCEAEIINPFDSIGLPFKPVFDLLRTFTGETTIKHIKGIHALEFENDQTRFVIKGWWGYDFPQNVEFELV